MTMLHLEMYELGTQYSINSWPLGEQKPKELKDPTDFLLQQLKK